MDHYKTLGLRRDATKDEIREAFRRCALKFHADRHSQSVKEIRDGVSLKFKQASEAYEVLMDDRKRADYYFGSRQNTGGFASSSSSSSSSDNYGGRGCGYSPPPRREARGGFDVGIVFRYVTRRGFLLNVTFARNHSKKQYTQLRGVEHRKRKPDGFLFWSFNTTVRLLNDLLKFKEATESICTKQ